MKFFDDNNANDSKTSPKICSVITEIGSHTTDPEEVEQLNTHEIPILALRNMVLFPEVAIPVAVGRKESLALIEEVQRTHALIGVICQKEESVDKPQFNDLHRVGVVADVLKVLEFPDGSTNVILQGKYPFELESITQSEPFLKGQIHTFGNEKPQNGDKEFDVLISAIKDIAINMLNNLGNSITLFNDSAKNQKTAIREIKNLITQFGEDKKSLKDLENTVNRCCNNVMLIVRDEVPNLSEEDYRQLCYHFAGFSGKVISMLLDKSSASIYTRKSRLKEKIQQSEAEHKDMILEYLS